MLKPAAKDLLYDPMPRFDVKLPSIREPESLREDSKKLIDKEQKVEQKSFLTNISFD